MKHFASILLVVCFAGLGSGLFRYAHDAAHAAEDARRDLRAPSAADRTSSPAPAAPRQHDETNCSLHAMLKAPLLHSSIVPLLVLAGLFVAFLTLLAPPPVSRPPLTRLDCRGPPSCRD